MDRCGFGGVCLRVTADANMYTAVCTFSYLDDCRFDIYF